MQQINRCGSIRLGLACSLATVPRVLALPGALLHYAIIRGNHQDHAQCSTIFSLTIRPCCSPRVTSNLLFYLLSLRCLAVWSSISRCLRDDQSMLMSLTFFPPLLPHPFAIEAHTVALHLSNMLGQGVSHKIKILDLLG